MQLLARFSFLENPRENRGKNWSAMNKVPFQAFKTQNFEKKYKIKIKVRAILHMLLKAYMQIAIKKCEKFK